MENTSFSAIAITALFAALAHIFWREVLPHFRNGGGGGGNSPLGSRSVDFWKLEMRASQREVLEQTTVPVFSGIVKTLDEVREELTTLNRGMTQLLERRGVSGRK